MFKTLIILYALSFWVTECTPNSGRSFPHWLAPKGGSWGANQYATLGASDYGPGRQPQPVQIAHQAEREIREPT